MTPRFASKVDRMQGALVAVLEDDRTIRFSSYSGAGTHMDDAFPDVSVDEQEMPQRVLLNGVGRVVAVDWSGGIVCVFRYNSEIEFFDLEAARSNALRRTQWHVVGDIASGRSLVRIPEGLIWMGNSGMYLIPVNTGEVTSLPDDIGNLIDGSLKLKNYPTRSVWSPTHREACIAGHDSTLQTVFFQVETEQEDGTTKYVQMKYSRVRKNFGTSIRNVGTGGSGKVPIKAFSLRADGTMVMIYGSAASGNGILEYPLLEGEYRFTDGVSKDGATIGNGLECKIKLMIGSLSGLVKKLNIRHIVPDISGRSTNKMGRYYLRLYGNRQSTAFDVKTIPIDQKCIIRGVDARRGDLENVEIEFEIPSTERSNIKEVVLSGFDIPYLEKSREGNR
jgi:hypothetical protein